MLEKKRLCVLLAFICAGGCATDAPTTTKDQPKQEGATVTGSRIPVRGGTVQPTGNVGGDDYRDSQRVTTQINKQGN